MNPVQVEAAALYVALVKAGMLEEAASFIDWAVENLDLDLEELDECLTS